MKMICARLSRASHDS